MDLTEWSGSDQGCVFVQFANDRIYLADFQYFFKTQWWKDGLESFAQHCLTTSWRSHQKDVVTSCCGDTHSSFECNMSLDMCEINCRVLVLIQGTDVFGLRQRDNTLLALEKINKLTKMFDWIDDNVGYIFQFTDIFFWDKKMFVAFFVSRENTWKESVHPFDPPIQTQFSKKKCLLDEFCMGMVVLAQ